MEFSGDIGEFQRRITETPSASQRVRLILDALSPRYGEQIIDIGCGSGSLVNELALAVGATGKVFGIDASSEQIEAARQKCRGLPAEFETADATALPFEDGIFDGAVSVQTLEYIDRVDAALAEIRRVSRPGARYAFISMMWDTFIFNGAERDLNTRVNDAWRLHCKHQMLPFELPSRMAKHGMAAVSQIPFTIFETSLNSNAYSHFASYIMEYFVSANGISKIDAGTWRRQLVTADREGRFGFIAVPVLTVGIAT
jgi:ubiquinone/menaquinone biosynthesis C-methylase UbiE